MQKTAGPKKFSFYPISHIDGVKTCKNWFLSKILEVEAFVWSLFFFVSMFLCFFVPRSLCFDVSLFLCFCSYVSLYLDFIVSMFLCLCASLFLCLFASLFLCFLVSLFLCLNFAKVHINLCLFQMALNSCCTFWRSSICEISLIWSFLCAFFCFFPFFFLSILSFLPYSFLPCRTLRLLVFWKNFRV